MEELITLDPNTSLRVFPHWVAQPYTRPLLDVTGKKLAGQNAAQIADAGSTGGMTSDILGTSTA